MSGNALRGPLASWDSGSGQWLDANGTSGDLFGQSGPFSGRWPTSGSIRNGIAYAHPTPGHLTGAKGFSSLLGLLPTPRATDGTKGGPNQRGSSGDLMLPSAVMDLLPTPNATDSQGGPRKLPERRTSGGKDHGPRLRDLAVAVLLPTPMAADGDRASLVMPRGNPTLIGALLPTPAAHDSANTPENHLRKKPGRSQVTSLQVIADYGLLSTGGRIAPPSSDGSESSDEMRQGQLNLDGPESG